MTSAGQAKINRLLEPDVTLQEILTLAYGSGVLIRANALLALGRKISSNAVVADDILEDLISIANDPVNQSTRLLGVETVTHFAIVCLLKLNDQKSHQAAIELLQQLDKYDQREVQDLFDKWEKLIS
jgi:hypothetical protein